ncbi:sugar transferase [Salibacter halophilus]|uniref:Sugar transferase n=1 Tax=Salibacter halophilus TaxID=1803916 RepID=A0A6N6M8Y5_9FLAO|nr:sugar transferase [Salibacter halophilus]KAB1064865.1 sugar transferase [Salibacter halophilus]
MNKLELLTKRLIDIIVSLSVITFVLSWLTPLLGILILLESRGGIFFIQSRDGVKGKPFNLIKFRTMTPSKTAHLIQAKKNDARITNLGSFLRKSHIDELPQFINILMGDMSLVGPRPHMHRDTKHYETIIDNYRKRLEVKPGFTGLAQAKGLHGNTSIDVQKMKDRVRVDNFYVSNISLYMDFMVIALSFQEINRKLSSLFSSDRMAFILNRI